MNNEATNKVDIFFQELTSEISPKAKSLIITFFGDSVFPYGGTIWLGSLINFMEEFGISEKLTRTSTFRLAKEGWLTSQKFGRESYYSLSDVAIEKFLKAHYNIYGYDRQDDDKDWLILFAKGIPQEKEAMLTKIMKKEGFANAGKQIFLHPNYKLEYLQDILIKENLHNSVLLVKGTTSMPMNKEKIKDMAHLYWDLDATQNRYQEFIGKFIKIFSLKTPIEEFSHKQCFILRTLLIHEYRRALLLDPKLGNEFLSTNWLGKSATSLVESIYKRVETNANLYIGENLTTIGGGKPKLDNFYFNRFGGIK